MCESDVLAAMSARIEAHLSEAHLSEVGLGDAATLRHPIVRTRRVGPREHRRTFRMTQPPEP